MQGTDQGDARAEKGGRAFLRTDAAGVESEEVRGVRR